MTLEERLKAAKGTRRKNDKAEVERKRQEFEQSKKTLPMLQTAKSGTSDKGSGGPRRTASTTTTTTLPMKSGGKKQSGTDTAAANVSSWLKEDKAKGSAQGIHDRMAQMLSGGSSTTPSQRKREQDRKSARRELSSLLSQTVTEEDRNDLTARIRAAQQTLNETKPKGKTRGNAESFALSAENLGSQLVRGVEAPLAAVSSVGYQALHDLTSLGGQAENPVSRWAERSAAGVQTLPISSTWQRSIQERYRPNETEQTVMDVTGNIASMLPSLALSAGIGAAAGAGQGAAALTAADTAAKGQRAGQLMMALQGMGSAAKEARDEGATTAQANLYGAADGLLGAATERISGGIPLLGSGVADKALANVKSPLVRVAADMAGEGFEEGLQTAAEPYLKRAIYDPNARNATPSEIGQSAAMGALASGALKLGIEAPQTVESGLQRFRAERPGRELTAQLRSASAQMDRDAQTARTRSLERLDPIGDVSGMGLTSDTGRRTMRAGDGLLPPRAFGEVDYDTAPEGAGRRTPGQYSADEIRASERGKDYRAQADADVPAMAERMAKAGNGRIDQGRMFQELRRYSGEDPERIVAAVESFRDLSKQAPYETAEDGTIWRHDLTRGVNGQLPDPNAPLSQDITVDRKSNAYSFDHPELRPYIVQAADGMKADLANTIRGERTYWYDQNAAAGENPNVWGGIKRQTAPDIAAMLDGDAYGAKMSYKTIDDGLDDILADHGKENSLRAKRVEAMLVDRLQNGYRDAEGRPMPSDDTFGLEWDALQTEQERGAADTRTQKLREKLADTRSQDASEPPYPELDFGDTDWRDADIQETGILPASERERLEAAQRRADMGQYQRGNTVDGTASRAYDGRIDRKEDVSYDQRRDRTDDPRGYGAGENAGGAGLSGEVRTGGPVETVPVRGRYGQRGGDASYAQKPVRSWVEGHTIEPQEGSVSHAEQQAAMEYGIPSFVVDDAAWDANEKHRNGFSTDGQIYIRSSIPEQARGMVTSHEANHVMRQTEYAPYLDFVDRTPGMLDFGTTDAQILLEHVAKHAGVDPASINGADMARLYDELTASVYGHIASGKMDGIGEGLRNAFRDFDAYASELSDIHRRFKEERGGGTGYGASQSQQTGRPVGPESSVGAAANDAYGPNTVGAAQSAVPAAEPRISKVETNTFAHSGLYDNVDRDLAGLKPEDLSYDPVSEKQSLSHAAERLANDYAGELDALPKQESWSGEDIDTAMGILSDERARAMQSGDWSEFQKWRKLIQEKGTRAGQLVQAFAKYSRTPEGILVDAGKILEGTKLRPEQQAEVLQTVSRQAARLEDIDTAWRNAGSDEAAQSAVKQDLIDTIKENSAIRKTGGFFGGGQTVSKRLAEALEGDSFDHLRDVALAQTANIAGDHVSASFLEKVNSYRTMGLLSNLGTTARNLVANNVFDPLDALMANNSMVPLDMLLSKLTGTRSVASVGSTPFNAAKRQAMLDGWNKSYIEVALDANAEGAQNKYGQTGNRTFKMTGNVAERLLSTWAKWQGYALNSTDEMQKGGIRQEETARAQKLRDKGLLRSEDTSLEAKPDEAARYRTFQDDTALSGMAEDAKRALDRIGIGERKGGGKAIGAGDLLLTFPKVPSNLVSRAIEYSPAGFLKGGRELADVLSKAHRASVDPSAPKVTALEQAHAVNDIGRALGGSALIALFAVLAKTGVLKVADAGGEESADQSALNTAERVSGTQLNLSAFQRLFTGKSTQWQDGDQLMSIGFLEPLNAHMATGALFANSMEDGDSIGETGRKFLTASGAGVAQSLKDMPAATGLTSIADQYRYADGDTEGMKALNTAKGYLEEQASSFVPNIIRAVAKATDPYVRDAYSGQTMEQQTLDSVKNAIPGLRQTLPTKKDVWGQDRTYGDNKVLNALNAILLPGAVNTYQTTKAAQALKALPEVSGSPVLPQRSAPKSLSYDGQTYALSAQERSAYQKARGGLHQQLVEQVAGTDWYRNASDEDKVSIMNDVRAYANDEAKRAVLTSRAGSYQSNGWERIHEAVENGVPASSAFIYHETKDADGDGTVSQSEAAGVLLPMKGLTDAQKSALWRATDRGWNEEKDPFRGTLPTKGGLSVEQSVKVLQTYRDIDKAEYTGDKVASQKQTAFSKALDGMGLTKDQRTVVDDTYKFWSMMPAKVQAYSVDTMSEAAQKHWPALKALDMSEAAYLQVYPIVAKTEKGYGKEQKLRDLMALGYSKSQANTIYSKIKSK